MNDIWPLRRIVSGGKTGVDRAALDVALERGIAHGGWCPNGRDAEDGVIPGRYELTETDSTDVAVRTRFNVRDSDGTLIIASLPLVGGTAMTHNIAAELHRPVFIAEHADADAPQRIRNWIRQHHIETLNVAGPRASTDPGAYDAAADLLRRVLDGADSENYASD